MENSNEKGIEVELELYYSVKRRVTVTVSDYDVFYSEVDENGYSQREIDTSVCDFEKAINEQVDFDEDEYEIDGEIQYEIIQ
jgi:hypothetical protein